MLSSPQGDRDKLTLDALLEDVVDLEDVVEVCLGEGVHHEYLPSRRRRPGIAYRLEVP